MFREVACFHVKYPVSEHRMPNLYQIPHFFTKNLTRVGFDIPETGRYTESHHSSSGRSTTMARDVACFHVKFPVLDHRAPQFY